MRKQRAEQRVKINRLKETSQQLSNAYPNMRKVLKINYEIEQLKDKIEEIKEDLHTKKLSTGSCFVGFKYKYDKDKFYEKYKTTFLNTYILHTSGFKYKGSSCKVEDAREPKDILWENLGKKFWTILKTRIYTYFGSLCLIAASFGIVLLLKNY